VHHSCRVPLPLTQAGARQPGHLGVHVELVRHLPRHERERSSRRYNDDALFAATAVRLVGGIWRIVLTPEQWATYVRESIQNDSGAAA